MMDKALFIFRRDLRLDDNTGLLFALESAKQVIPCFIFTPEQIKNNPYKSERCIQFMLESLEDLAGQLKKRNGKLYYFYGHPEKIVDSLATIDAVVVNRDYTPYSIKRDAGIEAVCKKRGIAFYSFDDVLLHPPEKTLKKDKKPYLIFTPYFRNASKLSVSKPASNRKTNYFTGKLAGEKGTSFLQEVLPKPVTGNALKGGREKALKILKKSYLHYAVDRDYPAKQATTQLSAYLKFGAVSPREAYQAFKGNRQLIRSLYWRDFFSSIGLFFPHVFEGAFYPKFNKIQWKRSPKDFKRWKEGTTGIPIVDAGMRELKQTGVMHNRVRMIAASFLIKDLHLNWQWGERHFAQSLIDYDPCINNGNWQWSAGTGCDAQPWFRIFNPWSQQKKFDPQCRYIKKWIPELKDYPPKEIHRWNELEESFCSYPLPTLEHSVEAQLSLKAYKSLT